MGPAKSTRQRKQSVSQVDNLVPDEVIQNKIYLIRGRKVILDKDLAGLYGVATRRLKEQVRRNRERFPEDFMFELSWEEAMTLVSRSQFATLKQGQNVKYRPYAFTEQGVAMLSSVLKSERAIKVNIQIMRTFVRLKEYILSHKDLAEKIAELESRFTEHDKKFVLVFEAIRQLLQNSEELPQGKESIGFHSPK